MHLLDVSVLIALCDPSHEFHGIAADWFADNRGEGWATCPLTENGLVRILGHGGYPAGPGSTAKARLLLTALVRDPGHVFWADDLSITDASRFPSLAGISAGGLTDAYLLALARHHGARFVTFDRGIWSAGSAEVRQGVVRILPP